MSFFDEGDEPRAAGARSTGGRRSRTGGSRERGGLETRTVRVRQAIAAGLLLLVAILLIVGVRACTQNRADGALRTYDSRVVQLTRESDQQVGRPLFALLSGAGGDGRRRSPFELSTGVNQLRVTAEQQLARARRLDAPDVVRGAQRNLELALGLRTDALSAIARQLPRALGRDGADRAVQEITGQMQVLLAADVLVSQRVAPLIGEALGARGLRDELPLPASRFLPAPLDWLDARKVAERLTGTAAGTPGGKPAPGTHGHGVTSVSIGNVTLQADAPNTIPAGARPALTVRFQNQGSNDERNVAVRVRVTGGSAPIELEKVAPTTKAGQPATVEVPIDPAPSAGTPLEIRVEVAPVPGEKMVDNNRQTFTATFSR